MSKPVAILCSDWHLSERAPVARAAEPDWFEAQARPLKQISILAYKHDVPVIVAGDVFDRWNASPATINFAIENMPHVYAIPGQHDLPNHSLAEIKRSAYWTLVEAEKITHLGHNVHPVAAFHGTLALFGFPWGRDLHHPGEWADTNAIKVAVIHRYVHTKTTSYPGAPEEQELTRTIPSLRGYDAAVFGANHKGFLSAAGFNGRTGVSIFNCGTMMRRKQDERLYRPQVGILLASGSISREYLDVSEDLFSDPMATNDVMDVDSTDFLRALKSLGADSLDFRASIMRRLERNDVTTEVRQAVLDAMGE